MWLVRLNFIPVIPVNIRKLDDHEILILESNSLVNSWETSELVDMERESPWTT